MGQTDSQTVIAPLLLQFWLLASDKLSNSLFLSSRDIPQSYPPVVCTHLPLLDLLRPKIAGPEHLFCICKNCGGKTSSWIFSYLVFAAMKDSLSAKHNGIFYCIVGNLFPNVQQGGIIHKWGKMLSIVPFNFSRMWCWISGVHRELSLIVRSLEEFLCPCSRVDVYMSPFSALPKDL